MFQTNNADFRNTDENLQQLAFARTRAIETGRSVVNISTSATMRGLFQDSAVAGSGSGFVIDPDGILRARFVGVNPSIHSQ